MNYQLHHGDCLDILPTLEPQSVDAVITDPPYNVNFKYASTDDNRNDYESWCADWLLQLERLCKGPIAISCGHPNIGMWHRIKTPIWVLCWWKPAAMGRSPVGFCNWDPIVLYGKVVHRKGCDVIRAPIRVLENINHPCPKPLAWGEGLVKTLTNTGATVLDPFFGSGTTGAACGNLGRRFIGIEKDLNYFKLASERIAAAYEPLRAMESVV